MTTSADIIVASVQANPPGGDVAVSPAVRVLVEEIVRLQGMLKRLGELSEADHNQLQVELEARRLIGDDLDDEIVRLRKALAAIRNLIENDNDNLNIGVIVDTVWISPIETLVDYIGTVLGDY